MKEPIGIPSRDLPTGIEDLMHSAYLQYSLSVNVGRAIPDVRDGLKPGNRRIFYAMKQLGLTKGHAYTKCAKVVGEVIGNYHPHGDQAVYDTLVRMAQDFSMRHPLIDGQGNFGSIDGDAPAAYRYTECRMERLAEELLADMDKNTVDMRPTFDEANQEPVVLPARFPNLLVNGATGIGVGMATNIPPHNLGEVIDATVALIDNPMVSIPELMQHLPGPDFPTGATVMGINSIIQLYETGHGVFKIRGTANIEEKKERERIIITEMPYAVNKERLVKSIAQLVAEKKIDGISGLNDESSSRTGIRIVIDIKRNAMANVVLNQLYKHTALETSFGAQFLVVDHNRPRTMNLRQVLQAYIDHRLEVITRRARFELKKAEDRAHILQGLLVAVDNIDDVVRIIRESRTRDEAARELARIFELTDRQTAAILDMRLHQLTGLAMESLQTEYDELLKQVEYLRNLLSDRWLRMSLVREELQEVRGRYTDPRRTKIMPGECELANEDLIPRSLCVITLSREGYIKRVPLTTYRTQNRGGVGVMGMQTKEEDYIRYLLTACSHDYIMFFTNHGRMYWLKVYEIPEGARVGKGKALVNLIQFEPGEFVQAMVTVDQVDVPDRYIVMATAAGTVKKTALNRFKHLRRKGIISIVLDSDDELIDAKLTDGVQELLLSSRGGMACRFNESDVRETGRKSRGVRGMELRGSDGALVSKVVSMTVASPEQDLLVVTERGMGKRTRIDKYRLTKRGGKGVISIKLDPDDAVVAALLVNPGDEIIMTSFNGQMVRISTDDIRTIGRSSKGVRIIRLREGDRVGCVSLVQELTLTEEEELSEDGSPADELEKSEETVNTDATSPPSSGDEEPPEENESPNE